MSHKSQTNSYTEFFYKAFRNILIVSIPLVVLSTLILGFIPHSSAEISGSTDNVSLTLSTSCTVNAAVTIAHETSLHGGQKDDNVGNTKLSAFCNDNNGYSIYAVGSSGDIDGNTDLIYNNGLSDSYNIRTGVYDSNNVANPSSWAMKLTAGTGTGIDPVTGESVPTTPPIIVNGYDNYSAIPNVYTQVAKRTSGTSMTTDTSVSGSYLNTTYQIYANSAQPAGTYNGKVKYIILHPGTDAPDTINDIDAAFAMAGKQKYPQESGAYYAMQDMTTDICNSVSRNGENTSTQLVDLRDNKLYWVTKLKDGHCWMTQNLDLDLVTYTNEQGQEVMKPLTSEDTDLTDYSLTGAYADGYSYDSTTGITSWTPVSTAKTINFEGTTVTGWQNSYTEPYSANKTDDTNTGHASLGNYYNWTAAIASNDSSMLTSDTLNNISQNPKNSICPKGWRLPTVSNQSESTISSTDEFDRINYLYNQNSSTSYAGLIISPVFFATSGYIYSVFDTLGINGYFSSSTVASSTYSYRFQMSEGDNRNVSNSYWRSIGMSVRCVAR